MNRFIQLSGINVQKLVFSAEPGWKRVSAKLFLNSMLVDTKAIHSCTIFWELNWDFLEENIQKKVTKKDIRKVRKGKKKRKTCEASSEAGSTERGSEACF